MSDDEEIRIRITRRQPPSALDMLVYAKWSEFAYRLKTRQATIEPDFKSLYRRKAELDRELLDRELPMTPAPNRRWFRYSLRTLFVVVTVFGCWLGYELNWIRQRRMIISHPDVQSATYHVTVAKVKNPSRRVTTRIYHIAPWPLFWMGETGYSHIVLGKGTSEGEVAHIRRLFPEAAGIIVDEP